MKNKNRKSEHRNESRAEGQCAENKKEMDKSWCHPTILLSVAPFSSCLQSFPASGSFPMSQLLTSGGQSIEASASASASASVLPVNIQDWFPLGLTGLISLLSKGVSRVFCRTTVWKHQSFGAQPSLWSNSNVYTWLLSQHLIESLDRYRILG